MVRVLKTRYDKFLPPSRRLTQTHFPTDAAGGLLAALAASFGQWLLSGLHRLRQMAAMILSCPSRGSSDCEEPAGEEGEGQGCERIF